MAEQRSLHLIGATGQSRMEQFDGREHLVVPVVCLIGDNVIHAVNAPKPEWVPASVLSAAGWNGRPLVIGHPAVGGKQVSANDPAIIERQGFGFMAATHVKDKKLGTEAWMDVAKLEKLGQHKMLADARAGKPIEVSVGAYVQTREVAGQKYASEWATMAPDHLAFLPGGTGACSVEMGCGANRAAMRVCEDRLEILRDIPQSERDKMDTSDFAGPDESFPIKTQADVDAAKRLIGKAKNPDAVKAKIIAIAKRKGLTIPDAWQSRGAQVNKKLKALRAILLKALDGDEPTEEDDDPDEAAETISYEAMRALIEQAKVSLDEGSKHIEALISDNGAGDSEEVEDAHLEALVAMCVQLYGTTNGVIKMATSCLAPEGATSPMAYMATAAGARHNKADQQIVQDTHDNMVQLGAECSAMKAAELKAACGCGGDSMTKEVRTATIKTLIENKDSGFTKDDQPMLEAMTDARLEALEVTAKAGIKTLAGSKADAEKVISDKATADAALAAHAGMLAAKKKKDEEVDEPKTAELKAAKAAGFDTVEEHERDTFYKKNPEIKGLVDGEKARKTARKTELVTLLSGGPLTDEQLKAKPLDELETLAKFAGIEERASNVDNTGRGFPVQRSAEENDARLNPPNGYDLAIAARKAH